MATKLSRRDFLKLTGLSLAGLAFRPFFGVNQDSGFGDLGRVAIYSVSVYAEPWDKSKILFQRYRDDLVNIYEDVVSEKGPGYNPLWYRVWGGYIHSAHIQKVRVQLNPVQEEIPEKGQLAEVTVPLSQALRYNQYTGWQPVYRLYFQSIHWITGLDEGPDGEPWYKLRDELLGVEYHVQAAHLRPILPDEYAPLSADVPPEEKRIEVSLARQHLTAYEGEKIVFETTISSGVPDRNPQPGQIPTQTPTGKFHVQSKLPSKHMGDGHLTSDPEAYELPGVPWTSFFEPKTGVAFHGTYWHHNYGVPMSHGCINMKPEEALWIFRWTTPAPVPGSWETRGYGTRVIVT